MIVNLAAILLANLVWPPGPPLAMEPAQPADRPAEPAVIRELRVRPGFEVSVAVDRIPAARFLETDGAGRLFVSRPSASSDEQDPRKRINRGDIVCLRDRDGDGFYETRDTFLTGPERLQGLCWVPEKDGLPGAGWLWYSTSGSIRKARDTNGDGVADEDLVVIKDGDLPAGGANWWRSILVSGDRFYTAIGDTANISDEPTSERQQIWSFALDGSGKKLFASGLRNTPKLRIRPGTGEKASEIWGIDQGSDWFGRELGEDPGNPAKGQPVTDLNPPDELNKYIEGAFYGHPYITGDRLPRYEYLKRTDIVELAAKTTPPALALPARGGAEGFTFIDPAVVGRTQGKSGAMPRDFAGDLIVAFHGSWNRSTLTGCSVARVIFDPIEQRPIGFVTLVDGVKIAGDGARSALIRPVDVVQIADGSVLFSCDMTGRVYRIRSKLPT